MKNLFKLYVFQPCQSIELWKAKSDKYIQVIIRYLATVLGTLCFFFCALNVAQLYFQQYLAGYRNKHFVGNEGLLFFGICLHYSR